ncbi:MAG: TolC family protein [Acidiferrobacter sp.]
MLPKIPALILLLGVLPACTTYAPKPLPDRVNFPVSATSLTLDTARLPFHNLSRHIFNPTDGLDMTEVAMLAVANNPQLRQARDTLGIARAQSFAAGLLPDPQFGLTSGHPTNGVAGNTNSFSFNLKYDVNALLLRSSRKAVALAQARRVNLDMLWQEWQVVNQARLLFTRLTAQQALMAPLETARRLLAHRYDHSRQALAAGNVTLDLVSVDLLALQNIERRINKLRRIRLQNRARLNGLLGLLSTTPLVLVGAPRAALMDAAAVQDGLVERLNHRPDLLALQAGYRSQEEKFRGTVLAQFPALTDGLTRARDTSGLYTVGFGLTVSLPIFNRNRGNIAIESATRTQLFDAYQARLNSAYSEVAIALKNQSLLQSQLQRTHLGLRRLQAVAQHAAAAFRAGNLAVADYVRLQMAWLNKQTEAIQLREALMEQQIALETLLGPDLPEHAKIHRGTE